MHRLWDRERERERKNGSEEDKESNKLNKREKKTAYDLSRKITWHTRHKHEREE